MESNVCYFSWFRRAISSGIRVLVTWRVELHPPKIMGVNLAEGRKGTSFYFPRKKQKRVQQNDKSTQT